MDINMPMLNGVQATKQINEVLKENRVKTKIIAFTALDNFDKSNEYQEARFDDYIQKPFDCNLISKYF